MMPTPLHLCSSCDGFVPEAAARCPHCATARLPRLLAKLAGAGAMLTLMACYGAMVGPPGVNSPQCPDNDGDRSCTPEDCNDQDPSIYPGSPDDDGDGIDQNCDGVDGWRDPTQQAT
jgi:hypothetical protein